MSKVLLEKNAHPAAPLLRALQEKVLPALEWNTASRIVIARAQRKSRMVLRDVQENNICCRKFRRTKKEAIGG